MASQLREVLNRFSDESTPVALNQLAHDMHIAPGVLQEMIAYWVRKGKLREVSNAETCNTCGVKGACPFVVTMPRYYEAVREGENDTAADLPCNCGGHCAT